MRLTTAEMAKLSGVSYRTLQDIEQERSEGSVQTMNRIFGVLGLRLGVSRIIALPWDLTAEAPRLCVPRYRRMPAGAYKAQPSTAHRCREALVTKVKAASMRRRLTTGVPSRTHTLRYPMHRRLYSSAGLPLLHTHVPRGRTASSRPGSAAPFSSTQSRSETAG